MEFMGPWSTDPPRKVKRMSKQAPAMRMRESKPRIGPREIESKRSRILHDVD